MIEYIEIGSTPSEEDCVQVDKDKDYESAMSKECGRYVKLLDDAFPEAGDYRCSFSRMWFVHEFGRYCEAIVKYDDENEESTEYAYFVERNLPKTWTGILPRYKDKKDKKENHDK